MQEKYPTLVSFIMSLIHQTQTLTLTRYSGSPENHHAFSVIVQVSPPTFPDALDTPTILSLHNHELFPPCLTSLSADPNRDHRVLSDPSQCTPTTTFKGRMCSTPFTGKILRKERELAQQRVSPIIAGRGIGSCAV